MRVHRFPSTSLCVLVGANSRIFSATDPFAAPASPTNGGNAPGKKAVRKRPRTHLVFVESLWKSALTRRHRLKARFHFYSRDGAEGFDCKHDHGRWLRCHSPLRYWVAVGHALRVRAIGQTGLRGPVAMARFKVVLRRAR